MHELMTYFYFEYWVYISLIAIMLICAVAATSIYVKCKKNKSSQRLSTYLPFLLIDSACLFSFWNILMFQGVISDISSQDSENWFSWVLLLAIICFLLFIYQTIITVLLSGMKQKSNS